MPEMYGETVHAGLPAEAADTGADRAHIRNDALSTGYRMPHAGNKTYLLKR